ncbi:hypothetical protein ACP70R_004435 [Stipagrostis hirtigluma subsp. patula]
MKCVELVGYIVTCNHNGSVTSCNETSSGLQIRKGRNDQSLLGLFGHQATRIMQAPTEQNNQPDVSKLLQLSGHQATQIILPAPIENNQLVYVYCWKHLTQVLVEAMKQED